MCALSKPISILLLIESRIYREGLELILARRSDVACFGACCDQAQLALKLSESRPDVILVDTALGADGLQPRHRIAAAWRSCPGIPIVALGLDEHDDDVLALFEAGSAAFVSKHHSIDELAAIIAAVSRGEAVLAPRLGRLLQQRLAALNNAGAQPGGNGMSKLSHRERHILDLVGKRLSNKQIARELGLEVSTIKNHMHNIIVKLGVKNRVEAAEIAIAS